MANENCLAGIGCPHCGHEDDFKISAGVMAHVRDDGVHSYSGDTEWTEDSLIICGQCKRYGTVGQFTLEGVSHATD